MASVGCRILSQEKETGVQESKPLPKPSQQQLEIKVRPRRIVAVGVADGYREHIHSGLTHVQQLGATV